MKFGDTYALKCTHLRNEHTLAGARPAIAALSLTRYEIICSPAIAAVPLKRHEIWGTYALRYTHLRAEHTLAGASPAIAAPSSPRTNV
jgi:hypothetical protein